MTDLFLAHCRELIGHEHVLVDEHDVAPYLTDWRGRFTGRARAVLRPADPAQVAGLVRLWRHAGPARASVSVGLSSGRLVLEVADNGAGGGIGQAGLGIAGMRERARGVGGELEAGTRPDGGFLVRAVLPAAGPSS